MTEITDSARQQLMKKAGEAAAHFHGTYDGCSQGVLKALQDHLGLVDGESFRAASALVGGIAGMGETCGSLVGGIMAIGLAFGRDKPESSTDSPGYMRAIMLSAELCQRFRDELGGTSCRELQKSLCGRSFDFWDPQQLAEWRSIGGNEKCRDRIVGRAAELAAELILANSAPNG